MARKAGARDIAPKMRLAFKRAVLHWAGEREEVYEYLAMYAPDPQNLTDTDALELVWLHLLRDNPKDALDTFSKYIPRELLLEDDREDVPHVISGEPMSEGEWLEQFGANETPH